MSSLLAIPRELRDQILTSVVIATTPRTTPQYAPCAEDRKPLRGKYSRGWAVDGKVMLEKRMQNRTELMPTLLVNRQLHGETLAIIAALSGKLSYELDVMVVNEEQLWPTWLSASGCNSSQIDKLRATFRVVPVKRHDHPILGFLRNDDGWAFINESFYFLLEDLLRSGPPVVEKEKILQRDATGEHIQDSTDKEISIKTLELNISTSYASRFLCNNQGPSEQEPDTLKLDDTSLCDRVNPRYLYQFIVTHIINRVLCMLDDSHTAAVGKLLFRRIGTIIISSDQEWKTEVDLGKRLGLNGTYPKIYEWKSKAWDERVKHGLYVMSLQDEEERLAEVEKNSRDWWTQGLLESWSS